MIDTIEHSKVPVRTAGPRVTECESRGATPDTPFDHVCSSLYVLRFSHPDWVAIQTQGQRGLEGTGRDQVPRHGQGEPADEAVVVIVGEGRGEVGLDLSKFSPLYPGWPGCHRNVRGPSPRR